MCIFSACIGAQDPYCGWDVVMKKCTTLEESLSMTQWEQSIATCPVSVRVPSSGSTIPGTPAVLTHSRNPPFCGLHSFSYENFPHKAGLCFLNSFSSSCTKPHNMLPSLAAHFEKKYLKRRGFSGGSRIHLPALFTTARLWKQPRCPSTDEWIKKLRYIYIMEYYSALKRNAFESVLMR